MGTWGDLGSVLLAGLSPGMYGAWQKIKDQNQQQAAMPTLQTLSDFNAQGWSSDPSFSGKEWTEGLLGLAGEKPDMSNPYVMSAVTGFQNEAQKEKQYSDQLQRMGRPVQEAGSLSRFAMNPETLPHLKMLEAAPSIFSAPTEYEQPLEERKFALQQQGDKANREAFSNADFLTREPTVEGVYNAAGALADVTGADPKFVKGMADDIVKQTFSPEKTAAASTPHVRAKQIGGGKVQDFQYDPSAPGADKWTIPIGIPYTPTAIQGAEMRMTGIPAYAPTGAFAEDGSPIVLNKKTGAVSVAKNPQRLDVAGAKQDYEASKSALRQNEVRLTALKGFTNRIDKTVPIINNLARKYGNNFGQLVNTMRNNIKRGVGNTGDLKSLELALVAIQGELGKVETGSLGMAGAPVTQIQEMRKIINESTNANDIIATMPTILQLSQTAKDSVQEVSDEIRGNRRKVPGKGTKQLDTNTARQFLQKAGGDKNRARELARQAGYSF